MHSDMQASDTMARHWASARQAPGRHQAGTGPARHELSKAHLGSTECLSTNLETHDLYTT